VSISKDELIIQRIDDLKDSNNQRLDSIDENLAQHMRRTDVLEDLHMDNQKRIETLEQPLTVLLFIKKISLYIAAIAGAILSVVKLSDYI